MFALVNLVNLVNHSRERKIRVLIPITLVDNDQYELCQTSLIGIVSGCYQIVFIPEKDDARFSNIIAKPWKCWNGG